MDTEDTIGLCGELLGLGRQLTILPFNASYYSGDSDSDGTQVQTPAIEHILSQGLKCVF